MLKLRIGVKGFTFDSSHYTKGLTEKCLNLHGHTFTLDVEVEGEIDSSTGMVIDFTLVKKAVKEVLSEYDHKVIAPKRDLGKIVLSGPFNEKIKFIDHPEATTEYIAIDIAKKIYEKLRMKTKVTLFEGKRSYVIAEYCGEGEKQLI